MSILGSLIQISPFILAKAKTIPSIIQLWNALSPSDEEEPKVDDLDALSSQQIDLLCDIFPSHPEQILDRWTLQDFTAIEYWRDDFPEDFECLKTEIQKIVMESKTSPVLDVGKDWHIVSYLFRGDTSMDVLPFLVREVEGKFQVNPILCGKELALDESDGDLEEMEECYDCYLEATEVREVSEALMAISEEEIRQRIEQGWRTQELKSVYSPHFFSNEEDRESCIELCLEVKAFYRDATCRGNAMLISIVP